MSGVRTRAIPNALGTRTSSPSRSSVLRRSIAWIPRADGACAISVECVSQKNAYAEECKHCYYDLSHHLAPRFAMPDRELLRTSR